MLSELVRAAATQAPERRVVIFPNGELAYGECLERAEAIACGLRARDVERFGCVLESAADTVLALVASTAVGSEACVYPHDPGAKGHSWFATRFGHKTVLSDTAASFDGAQTVALEHLERTGRQTIDHPERFPVLILTTGTTGEQKGARHDWRRLLEPVRQHHLPTGKRWLLAYNLNQFAGIQVLLHVLASGGTLVEPASRQADEVISTIRERQVTHVSATPTFWRLLVGRLGPSTAGELPLQQITLGGEAAAEGLIQRLHELFPQAAISHVYAGTEFGSAISVSDGRSGLPASVLERGENADAQLRIVEGELQIRSRVGMLGYYSGTDDFSAWRSTGDLVEVRDGRVQFTGRTSEIINVGGAKIHPLPVEEVICSVNGVQLAAVYGRANAVTGQIVVADVVAAPGTDTAALEARIRAECQALPAAGRPRRIRFVPELDIHGSKLMRHEAP